MIENASTDRLSITRMRLWCIIGLRPHERVKKQQLLVSLVLHGDLSKAAASDDLTQGVDYSRIQDRVVQAVEASSFHLIETLAEHIARTCLDVPGVLSVEVTVEKPHALAYADSVGVTIVRDRSRE